MAKKIQAVTTYGPRLVKGPVVKLTELINHFVDGRSGLNRGSIHIVLDELHDAVIRYCLAGRSVNMEGLGTFSPIIKLDGRFSIIYRMDTKLREKLNYPNTFIGKITNYDNAGKTLDDLITLWNEEHPDDPIEP